MANYWYNHVHVMCPDPLKTAQFYEKMFGARKESIREWEDGRMSVTLNLNGSSILLGQPRFPPKSTTDSREDYSPEDYYGLQHFGLVTDNLEEAMKELKAKGAEFREEITVPRPVKQEIIPLHQRRKTRIAFMWAPDNVLIELMEVLG
jgi:catechol 2,3-dioxygenase-like lactoylglutathione lyase family enzyme